MKEAPFYIGQKVVRAVADSNNILQVGKEYIVSAIKYCCSKWGWRIALESVDNSIGVGCEHCDRQDVPHWAAKNFIAIEENHYEDCTKELAKLPQDEVPDVKQIKELVN